MRIEREREWVYRTNTFVRDTFFVREREKERLHYFFFYLFQINCFNSLLIPFLRTFLFRFFWIEFKSIASSFLHSFFLSPSLSVSLALSLFHHPSFEFVIDELSSYNSVLLNFFLDRTTAPYSMFFLNIILLLFNSFSFLPIFSSILFSPIFFSFFSLSSCFRLFFSSSWILIQMKFRLNMNEVSFLDKWMTFKKKPNPSICFLSSSNSSIFVPSSFCVSQSLSLSLPLSLSHSSLSLPLSHPLFLSLSVDPVNWFEPESGILVINFWFSHTRVDGILRHNPHRFSCPNPLYPLSFPPSLPPLSLSLSLIHSLVFLRCFQTDFLLFI